MTKELVDGFYGGDELSLVNFSELEPDEVLAERYKKKGEKWLLVSFKSKQNNAHFGKLCTLYLKYIYMYINRYFFPRHFTLWLPALSTTSQKAQIPHENE